VSQEVLDYLIVVAFVAASAPESAPNR